MENSLKTNYDEILVSLSKRAFDNPLKDIENYYSEMTISQVVKFFEKKGISFTKTMIQNYIRINLLPPPIDKRLYSKNHLIILVIIDRLKNIFSLEEMKLALGFIIDNHDFFDNNNLMDNVYKIFLEINSSFYFEFESIINSTLEDNNKKDYIPINSLIPLKLMIFSSLTKFAAQKSI